MKAVRCIIVVLVGLAGVLPLPAFGAPVETGTISNSSQTGPFNALVILMEDVLGPGTIFIGDRTGCLLVPPPTLANCSPPSTPGYPYYSCSGTFTLAGCGGGTQFEVLAGTTNVNVHSQTVVAVAPTATQPVPLSPWVPLASVAAVLLMMLVRRRQSLRG